MFSNISDPAETNLLELSKAADTQRLIESTILTQLFKHASPQQKEAVVNALNGFIDNPETTGLPDTKYVEQLSKTYLSKLDD